MSGYRQIEKRIRSSDTGGTGAPSSSNVTPKKPLKKRIRKRRSRMPDPTQSTNASITSSQSSLSVIATRPTSAQKRLQFTHPRSPACQRVSV